MKRLLLLIAVTLTLTAKSQTSVYHPFPDSNATWCCSSSVSADAPLNYCYNNSWNTYQLNGYSLINGKTYSRLLFYILAEFWNGNCAYSHTYNDSGAFFIRQDIALKTVWLYDSTSRNESVLYNFNLSVGDTLDSSKVGWGYSYSPFIITSIDSILINGNYRKRYNYSDSTGCASSIIEGIGSINGLMDYKACGLWSNTNALDKFTQNNIVLFGGGGSCHNFPSGIDETKIKNQISIFPNPFHSTATLQLSSEFENAELIIYNALGQQIKELKINAQTITINRNALQAGIYFFKVTNSSGQLIDGKFIVE